MFVLRKNETNKIPLIISEGIKEFIFVNQLSKKKITMSINGVKQANYAIFDIDTANIPKGSYTVFVGDELATLCTCIGLDTNIKSKYQ